MKNKDLELILKYFNEPQQYHDDCWIMRPRFNNFDTIISVSYERCWEEAQRQIENHFIVKP